MRIPSKSLSEKKRQAVDTYDTSFSKATELVQLFVVASPLPLRLSPHNQMKLE